MVLSGQLVYQQWHHQQGNDNDMDSDLAWNVATGSDQFVVAIVDLVENSFGVFCVLRRDIIVTSP